MAPTMAAMQNEPDEDDIEQQRADTDTARKLAQQQTEADIKWLMADPRGRRFMWSQLAAARLFHSSFNPDVMQMAFNEGNRNSGIRLTATLLQHCPDLYHTMTQENQK